MTNRRSRRRAFGDFDLVAVPLILLLIGVLVGWTLAQRPSRPAIPPELIEFRDRYAATRNSRHGEEWLVRDFFQDRQNGIFVDVGANHYRSESNTYYLETALAWSGVAVEPQEQFAADYRTHRPRTQFFASFASDHSDGHVSLFIPESNSLVASMSEEFTRREGHPGAERHVPTMRLTDILDRAGITKVDFLSVDVELAEPLVLAGFDIDRFHPELVCIEAHPDVRQFILDYFSTHNYKVIGRYLRADPANLWFTPAQTPLHDAGSRLPNR